MKNINKYTFLFSIVLLGVVCVQNANAQQLVEGTIISANTQEPIAFANVGVMGKAQGTIADENGHFEILVSETKNPKLVVSHINYYKQELNINSFSVLSIALKPKDIQLEEVVVSEALYEKPLNKLTRQASVISNRTIQEDIHANIIDVVASTPGITQVWEYHSPVILRGLNSNRIIIMKDGNRRIGTFPGGYFGQDMNIYDTKKIEIVKGPGSVIYGSGAISGIINVISNEPFGNKDLKTTISSAYGSNNQEFLEIAKVCYKSEKFGISANGKYRNTNDYIYGNGETAENTAVEDRDLTLNTGYRFSDEHQMVLNGSYHYGDWGKAIGFNNNENTQINNLEESVHSDVAYTYAPNKLVESVHFNLFYDEGTRDYYKYVYNAISGDPSTLTLVHYKNNYGGVHIYSIFDLSENNKLTLGVDGYLFHLDDPSEYYDYNDDTHYTTDNYNNAGQQNVGVFVNDEWITSEKLRFVAGVRCDDYKVFEGSDSNDDEVQREAVSGNFGFVFSPTLHTNFSFNVGRAFRMPTSSELFATVVSCAGTKEGNPDLNPEYGWNFDLGMRGKALSQKLRYDMALFYIQLKDYINTVASEEDDVDYTYNNTNAELMGGELSAAYPIKNLFAQGNNLAIAFGAAYVYGVDKAEGNDDDEPLFGIPPFDTSLALKYHGLMNKGWISGYQIKFETKYAAAQNRVAAIPEGTSGGPWGYVASDPHTVLNAALGVNSNVIPGSPKLKLVVSNLLDNNYQPFGSYVPAMGRNIKLMLNFKF